MTAIKNKKPDKEFKSVEFFREVKANISKKIYGKSLKEIQEYFKNRKRNLT